MPTIRSLVIVGGLAIFVLFISLNSVGHTRAQTTSQFPDGLVAWWPADGNALDIIGSHNGTLLDGATFAPGKIGQAFSFDGVNARVSLGSNNIIGTGNSPFTVLWWMYSTRVPSGSYYFPVLLNQDSQFFTAFSTDFIVPGSHIGSMFRGASHQWLAPVDQSQILNHWVHVAAVYNGGDKSEAGSYVHYMNGVQVPQGTTDLGPVGYNCGENDNSVAADSCGSNFTFFQGLIDELQVYNRALSATDVQAICCIARYLVSGNVNDGHSSPIPNVTISASSGISTTTDASGYYTITGLITGTYTITPTKTAYTFSPPSRTVNVPPNATGQDYAATPVCPTLTIASSPTSGGSVAASFPGNCNNGAGYTAGISVTLTATATQGYQFTGWSGDVSGSSKIVRVVIDGNKTVTANFAPLQPSQKPSVILVHGWHGLGLNAATSCDVVYYVDDQTTPTDFGPIPSWLKSNFNVWVAQLTTSLANTPPIEVNAACLKKQIDDVYYLPGNYPQKVAIIAHSMGGIVSRKVLEDEPDTYNLVNTLITLGSPHLGLPPSTLLFLAPNCAGDVGGCDLSMPRMIEFNLGHLKRNSQVKHYVAVGGLETNWPARFDSGLGDGIIPLGSSTFLPGSTPYITAESHHPFFGYPTYMQQDEKKIKLADAGVSFRCIISPTLNGTQPPPGCSGSLAPRTQAAATLPLVQSPLISNTISASQEITHLVQVDSNGFSTFNLAWITGTLDFCLLSPTGQVITPGYAALNPSVVLFSSQPITSPFGAIASYVFTATTPGLWTLQVSNPGPVSPVTYRVQNSFESPLTTTARTDRRSYAIGSSVFLTAVVSSTMPITGLQASGVIAFPGGVTQAISMTAAGLQLTGNVTIPGGLTAGYAVAQITVSGYASGIPFTREADADFLIQTNGAKLAGVYADYASDYASPLYGTLSFDTRISVTTPATYTLAADLMAGGQIIAHSQTEKLLASGQATLTIKFSGDAIRLSQLSGPYTMTDVVLTDSSSYAHLADSANAVWATASYDWHSFAASCYVLSTQNNGSGTIGAKPMPNCNAGLQYTFDSVVALTATANPGNAFVSWSGDVVSSSNPITVTLAADLAVIANFTVTHSVYLPFVNR